jgi:hypothetical protein
VWIFFVWDMLRCGFVEILGNVESKTALSILCMMIF